MQFLDKYEESNRPSTNNPTKHQNAKMEAWALAGSRRRARAQIHSANLSKIDLDFAISDKSREQNPENQTNPEEK